MGGRERGRSGGREGGREREREREREGEVEGSREGRRERGEGERGSDHTPPSFYSKPPLTSSTYFTYLLLMSISSWSNIVLPELA